MTKEQARNWRRGLKVGFTLWWVTIAVVLTLGMFGAAAVIMLLSIVGWFVLYLCLAARMPKLRKLRSRRSSHGAEIEFEPGMHLSASVIESDSRTGNDAHVSTFASDPIASSAASFEHSSPTISVFDLNSDGTLNFSGTGVASSGLHDL